MYVRTYVCNAMCTVYGHLCTHLTLACIIAAETTSSYSTAHPVHGILQVGNGNGGEAWHVGQLQWGGLVLHMGHSILGCLDHLCTWLHDRHKGPLKDHCLHTNQYVCTMLTQQILRKYINPSIQNCTNLTLIVHSDSMNAVNSWAATKFYCNLHLYTLHSWHDAV